MRTRVLLGVASAALASMTAATVIAAPAATAAGPGKAVGKRPAAAAGTLSCAALAGLDVHKREIGLKTSGGEVTESRLVVATGTGTAAVGQYCLVTAAVRPKDRTAPDIRMQVALPTQWNTKTLMFGGGGYNGTIPSVTQNVPFGPVDQPTPLGRGYVTYASDSGHQAVPGAALTPSLEGSFLANDEALANFSGDALKKTHDTAMFLVERYYGSEPTFRYFAGGSTGGREALAVAQRWPHDFDGIISAYPAWNAATLDLYFGFVTQQLSAPGAFPRPAQQVLLYQAVMQNCDALDGARDGVISDEAACDFDPVELRCPSGVDTGDDACLSDAQIRAIRAISGPIAFPYRLGSGESGYPGFPYLSGAAMHTPVLGLGTTAPADPMPRTAGYGSQFWDQWVRYAVTRDPSFDATGLDPLTPGQWEKRISKLTKLQDVNDTNLRPFANFGGKLILIHGTADELVSHRSTVEYYERLVDAMGQGRVEDFVRFYLVPGANHANFGSPAFVAAWDSLTALDAWVTAGVAPSEEVVTDRANGRTRPLCEYPDYPRYVAGDPDAASNFACVASSRP